MATQQVVTQPVEHHLTKKSLPASRSPLDLLAVALENNAAIDVIERLAALQEKAMARDAEILFNETLSKVQAEISQVAPDLVNSQTSSRYASYDAIDRKIRPIYTSHGMSLSFSHGDSIKPEHVRVLCFASLGAYTRTYQIDMPCDGKGPKGNDVMSKTHATAAADSYAKRYLVKDIFNIAIGEADTDGNASDSRPKVAAERVKENCQKILAAPTMDAMKQVYFAAYREAGEFGDQAATDAYIAAKDRRRKELANGNR